jgi:hypothetical protein
MMSDRDKLCATLQASIDEIVIDWINRVKADSYIHSDDPLTIFQIVDHVPQMLEELCKLLKEDGTLNFEAVRAASSHGYARSLSGYTLTELIRELELLRDSVFSFIVERKDKDQIDANEIIRGLLIVNQYFGEDIIFVVEHYLKQKKSSINTLKQ